MKKKLHWTNEYQSEESEDDSTAGASNQPKGSLDLKSEKNAASNRPELKTDDAASKTFPVQKSCSYAGESSQEGVSRQRRTQSQEENMDLSTISHRKRITDSPCGSSPPKRHTKEPKKSKEPSFLDSLNVGKSELPESPLFAFLNESSSKPGTSSSTVSAGTSTGAIKKDYLWYIKPSSIDSTTSKNIEPAAVAGPSSGIQHSNSSDSAYLAAKANLEKLCIRYPQASLEVPDKEFKKPHPVSPRKSPRKVKASHSRSLIKSKSAQQILQEFDLSQPSHSRAPQPRQDCNYESNFTPKFVKKQVQILENFEQQQQIQAVHAEQNVRVEEEQKRIDDAERARLYRESLRRLSETQRQSREKRDEERAKVEQQQQIQAVYVEQNVRVEEEQKIVDEADQARLYREHLIRLSDAQGQNRKIREEERAKVEQQQQELQAFYESQNVRVEEEQKEIDEAEQARLYRESLIRLSEAQGQSREICEEERANVEQQQHVQSVYVEQNVRVEEERKVIDEAEQARLYRGHLIRLSEAQGQSRKIRKEERAKVEQQQQIQAVYVEQNVRVEEEQKIINEAEQARLYREHLIRLSESQGQSRKIREEERAKVEQQQQIQAVYVEQNVRVEEKRKVIDEAEQARLYRESLIRLSEAQGQSREICEEERAKLQQQQPIQAVYVEQNVRVEEEQKIMDDAEWTRLYQESLIRLSEAQRQSREIYEEERAKVEQQQQIQAVYVEQNVRVEEEQKIIDDAERARLYRESLIRLSEAQGQSREICEEEGAKVEQEENAPTEAIEEPSVSNQLDILVEELLKQSKNAKNKTRKQN